MKPNRIFAKKMIPNIVPKQKIVFLGDQNVGKTSIINRFLYDKFDSGEKVFTKLQ